MNELRVFQNSEFGELGVMEIDGKTYFPATKCAKVLGYGNAKQAIIDHCKGVVKRDLWVCTGTKANGENAMRNTPVNFIPEGDLYRLIVSSRLPSAERFEKWVFDEVLPTIRKQGAYVPDMGAIVAAAVKETIRQVLPLIRQEYEQNERKPYAKRKPSTQSAIWMAGEAVRQDMNEIILRGRMTYRDMVVYMLDKYNIKTSKSAIASYASKLYDVIEGFGEKPYSGLCMAVPDKGYADRG